MDYYLERGGIPLHDAVEVNCNNVAATEDQGAGAGYFRLRGVFVDWVSKI